MNIDFRCYRSSHVGGQHDDTWKLSINRKIKRLTDRKIDEHTNRWTDTYRYTKYHLSHKGTLLHLALNAMSARVTTALILYTSSFVSIISELSHMFGQALAQWRAFSLGVARSSRLHSFSRSGHLSRCCMVCSEVPHSQAVSAVSA